jgi:hypothetical protein
VVRSVRWVPFTRTMQHDLVGITAAMRMVVPSPG